MPKLLTAKDISELLGVGEKTARMLISTMAGAFVIKGGASKPQYRITEDNFQKYIEKMSVTGGRRYTRVRTRR